MLVARLTDLELVGKLKNDKKRDHFVVVQIDGKEIAKSKGRYGLAPLKWQEDLRIEFHPSSTIKLSLFRHSIIPLHRPYEKGLHNYKVIELLKNNNVTTRLDLTEDGSTGLASLNVKISLITDPAGDIIRRVDADLARLKDGNIITSASGQVDNATAIAQAGGQAVKFLGSCIEPLGNALQFFVKVMDGVADAHPFVKVSWTIISSVYKTVQAQTIQDAAVLKLAELLREMVGVAERFQDLLKVKGTTDVIEEISQASVEIALLIDEYTGHSFIVRAVRFQMTDGMKSRIGRCENNCRDLIEKFDRRLRMDTNIKVTNLETGLQEGFKTLKNDALAKDISKWLNAPDSSRNYNDARKRHQMSTGSWFVDGKIFSEWKNIGRFLCLYGKAGCGKTILSSSIVANILDICMKEKSSTCAYFFFDGRDAQSTLQRHDEFIRSLIQQFTDKCDGIPAPLVKLYGEGHQQPSTEALEDVLQQIYCGFPDSYIIIDSLDECAERIELLKWINKVASSKTGNLHLLVTSRPEVDIKYSLRPFEPASITMEEGPVNRDIEAYIDSKIKEGRLGDWPEEVHLQIKEKLMGKAQGMFRWLAMQLEELQNCFDEVELYEQLERLPKDLDETYSRVLARIPEQRRTTAKILLQWIAFSAYPLSLEQLCESAAVELDEDDLPKYNPRRRPRTQDVLAACPSLVIESDGDVKLAHFTVKEYLLSDRITNGAAKYFGINEKLTHLFIAETSLAYLLHWFDSPASLKDETVRAAPLAKYAASKWAFHVQSGGGDSVRDIYKRIMTLLESESPFTMWVWLWNTKESWSEAISPELTVPGPPLYYASRLGLTGVSRQLLDNGADINASGGAFISALQIAVFYGNKETVKLLLDRGADITRRGGYFHGPLQFAAIRGDEAIMKLLIEWGAERNMQVEEYNRALHVAASHGNREAAQLLLEGGADINAEDSSILSEMMYAPDQAEAATPLRVAILTDNLAFVQFLLDRGADVSTRGGIYGSPFLAATLRGDGKIMKLLIERGAESNLPVEVSNRALCTAASGHGDLTTVQLLLERGADANLEGKDGSVLLAALEAENWDIAKLLIERAEFNLKGGEFMTPLQAAAFTGNLAIVQLLLGLGAEVNTQEAPFGCPLQLASFGGHEEIVKLLLENHADVNARGLMGGHALMMASIEGRTDVVKLLLENHADVNAPARDFVGLLEDPPDGKTVMQIFHEKQSDADAEGEYTYALQAASHKGHTKIVEMLLAGGADANAQGGTYGSALRAALDGNNDDIAKVLLENGATPLPDLQQKNN